MFNNQNAFTLIEALIVISIISILSLITIPSLNTILRNSQDESLRNHLLTLINTAQQYAAVTHKTIILCKTSNQKSCSGTWSDGQMIFFDNKKDGIIHNPDQIISVHKIQKNRGTLHARFFPRYREFLQFSAMNADHYDNGTFWYCHPGDKFPVWAITIGKAGNINVKLPDKNGEIHDGLGKMFAC